MLDTIVQIKLMQIKRVAVVVPVQHPRRKMGHKGTKRRTKVVRRTNLVREIGKLDPSAAARKDA